MIEAISDKPPIPRIEALDQIRGFALLAIFLCNLPALTGKFYGMIHYYMDDSHLDRAYDYVWLLFGDSARPLFAFMFGISMILIHNRFNLQGCKPMLTLTRRMLLLLLIGFIHLFYIWDGDILFMYAIDGLLLLTVVKLPPNALLLLGLLALGLTDHGLQFIRYVGAHLGFGIQGYSNDILQYNVVRPLGSAVFGAASAFPMLQTVQREIALALNHLPYFLLGMWACRAGFFERVPKRKIRWGTLALGLLAAGLYGKDQYKMTIGSLFYYAYPLSCFAVSLAFAILIVLMSASDRWGKITRMFAPIGRMAFTGYLVQSLFFVTLFARTGESVFGEWGELAPVEFGYLLPLGLLFFAVQMAVSALWLRYFRYGPFEWIWRWGTYGQKPPMLKR